MIEKYLGPDNVRRTPQEHVKYLFACADRWEATPGDKVANAEWAERVRGKARKLAYRLASRIAS